MLLLMLNRRLPVVLLAARVLRVGLLLCLQK